MTPEEFTAWVTEIDFATTTDMLIRVQVELMRPEAMQGFEQRMKLWHYAHRKLGALYSQIDDGRPRVFRKEWVPHDPR